MSHASFMIVEKADLHTQIHKQTLPLFSLCLWLVYFDEQLGVLFQQAVRSVLVGEGGDMAGFKKFYG